MNWEYYDVEFNPHEDEPDLVHLQLCVPSAIAGKIVAAMEGFPANSELAVEAIIWALRSTN